jgi:putative nucleotidyltransferase with HDIG domain
MAKIDPEEKIELQNDVEKLKADLKKMSEELEEIGGGKVSAYLRNQFLGLSNSLAILSTKIANLEKDRNNLLEFALIGGAVNSKLHTNDVLQIVIDTIIKLTGAERTFLMLKGPDGELELRIGRNWQRKTLSLSDLEISRTIIGRVVETGKGLLTTNAQEDPLYQNQASVIGLNLRSIMCVPLSTKEEIIGVIYADNRTTSGMFSPSELTLLSAFADQAAIALQNAKLYEDLQHTHNELQESYDTTLEGWATALEYRDQETEEHTRRVTVLTERLAVEIGMDNDNLVHVRRGAVLHDIGKMGIPDRILHKPGALEPDERKTIEQHPQFAYEMLSQIKFLQPALDIPYCHHEKWDGTGYPRGLKGEEIPLPARIFSVVDVWDALTSNRPYRQALPKTEVIEYLKECAGTHFDPSVVDAFVKMQGK